MRKTKMFFQAIFAIALVLIICNCSNSQTIQERVNAMSQHQLGGHPFPTPPGVFEGTGWATGNRPLKVCQPPFANAVKIGSATATRIRNICNESRCRLQPVTHKIVWWRRPGF